MPRKCTHGKRGNCLKCKEENENAILLNQKIYDKIEDEKRRKYQIQLNIVSNNQKILDQLNIFNSQDLEQMLIQSPYEFEHSVAQIFQKLGYKTKVTKQSNDKGKDIIMFKDGNKYLVECKRYGFNNLVNRPELQKFVAAIYEEKALKGFFVTTSDFTSSAYAYPNDINNKIELINGMELMKLYKKIYPSNSKFMQYKIICEECGDNVNFTHPGELESNCKNNHKVKSNIEQLIKSKTNKVKIDKKKYCPKCNENMNKKWSKKNNQHFWGCNNYPMCNGTLPLDSNK